MTVFVQCILYIIVTLYLVVGGRAEAPKPKRRVYINQNLFRDPFERTPGYNNEGCELCEVVFQNQEEMEQHKATDSHQIREMYHTRR